ncbi:MAG: ABC transporter ATP-binding protein [Miltoncostaeaceae bacterium]
MPPPAIESVGLTKRYGAQRGIESVDLRVGRGELLGFLGPNGAGKTTFIRLALGLLRPTEGRVAVMGHDVERDRRAALREVGYLPGELALYPGLSGRRTLDLLGRLHPRPPALRDELIDVVQLAHADLRRPVGQYSRGMKQKLGLISALQHDPPLAILDEPSGGLDPVTQLRVLDWLGERARGGDTVLFSSHVLAEVERVCDRVAMVREGRLFLDAATTELGDRRVRMVQVEFEGPVSPERYLTGAETEHRVEGDVHRFVLSGAPDRLLAALAELPVADLTIERPRLEDIFRGYYDDAESSSGRERAMAEDRR